MQLKKTHDAAMILMERFYNYLIEKKMKKSDALLQAKRYIRDLTLGQALEWCRQQGCTEKARSFFERRANVIGKSSPAYPHPYYWAGFVLIGDPE